MNIIHEQLKAAENNEPSCCKVLHKPSKSPSHNHQAVTITKQSQSPTSHNHQSVTITKQSQSPSSHNHQSGMKKKGSLATQQSTTYYKIEGLFMFQQSQIQIMTIYVYSPFLRVTNQKLKK